MRVSMRTLWPLTALLLAALACASGTSGGVIGSGESCRSTNGTGYCEGTYKKLSGTYGKEIEDDALSSGDAIDVQVQVSVEEGGVRLSLTAPDGSVASVDASPGNAATLSGVAEGDFGSFEVTFEALEGSAGGVHYRIDYQVR